MMKCFKMKRLILAVGLMTALSAATAFAAGWSVNSSGNQVYVQDDGSIVKSSWIKAIDTTGATIWYYAKADGALRTDGWETVSGKRYYFNADGVMQTGWIDDYRYYCDPVSGAATMGWKNLVIPEELLSSYTNREKYSSGDTAWFYFNPTNGQKYRSDNYTVVVKSIGGLKYGFDENGIMQTGWSQIESTTPAIAGYTYFAEKSDSHFKLGQQVANTWYTTIGPMEDEYGNSLPDLATGDVEYFYFRNNGRPVAGDGVNNMVQSVGGKRYLFNDKGNPVYGMQKGVISSSSSEVNYYFCGSSKSECSVKTGKFTMTQGSGDRITFYAESSGKGLTGVKDGFLYYMGRLQKADSAAKYMVCTVNNKDYVISASGQLMKNKTKLTDGDGNKFSTNSDGTLKAVIDGSPEYMNPEPPTVDDI